jgi:hypothetical protein
MTPARIGTTFAAAITIAACSFGWDDYDPRLGGGASGASAGVSGAGAFAGASGGTDGGSGGIAGAGGAAGSGGASGSSGGSSGGTSGTSGGGTGGSGGSSGLDGGAGAAGSGGAVVQTATYSPPDVADCIALVDPDPDACEKSSGLGQMTVDSVNSGLTGSPASAAFLSFALDAAFAGKQVLAVRLQLTVSNHSNANSNKSGEIWSVEPFTRPDLFTTVPAQQGGAPLAVDLGPVVQLQVVEWQLPTSAVTAGQSVYLGVFPTSSDGVDYYAKISPAPPKLIVEYQ